MSDAGTALPGQPLAPTQSNNIGAGTHIHGDKIYSSLAGTLSTDKSTKPPTLSITNFHGPLLPETGTQVLGRITRTTPRQAHISILALGVTGSHVLREPLPGLIRQQDIRATEIDKVKVTESFRVGDIVRAVVISLGDERSYYLSTARNEYGVVMAWSSETGSRMFPVSWKEFEEMGEDGAGNGRREARKVAKPV